MYKSFFNRRVLVTVSLLALTSLALTGAAVASGNKGHHKRTEKGKTFAPKVITRAAEVTAVELDPLTQQFAQVTFDRGLLTAVSSGSVTLEQIQDGAIWRTQSFTVPSNAVVTLNGKSTSLSQIPTGAQARVESSGSVGSTLTVVRVDAYSRGNAPLPATSSS